MNIFVYDKTFDGLMSAIFDAFKERLFPDAMLACHESAPLLSVNVHIVETNRDKSLRVWQGLTKKLSPYALKEVMTCWLALESEAADTLIARYACRIFSGTSQTDFSNPDVLALRQLYQKVSKEKLHIIQFLRFQKMTDGVYFAALAPRYPILALALNHFKKRFAGQKWAIYDLLRSYGYYYDMDTIHEIKIEEGGIDKESGQLDASLLSEDEAIYQKAWRCYFKSVSISERANPKQQLQYMPRRFWRLLTEKQDEFLK